MPTIPTFTAKSSITSEPSSVVSDIKLSPRSTMASALLPAANQVQAYAIKKRDNEEKLQAKKTLLELKAESDKVVESLKNNPNEQESIDVWKTNFQNLSKNKIANIQNKRIKKLVEDSLSLEESESIYHLKTNSFKAYEKESIQVYNDKINKLLDLKIFLDVDNKTRLERRIIRDVKERGRSIDEIKKRYKDMCKPMYDKFILPTKNSADIISNSENSSIKKIIKLISKINE